MSINYCYCNLFFYVFFCAFYTFLRSFLQTCKRFLIIFIIKAINSKIFRNGIYNKLLFIFWCFNCAFWMQLFNSDLLVNLTTKPMIKIDTLEQVINDANIKILMENIGFAYNIYFKVFVFIKINIENIFSNF